MKLDFPLDYSDAFTIIVTAIFVALVMRRSYSSAFHAFLGKIYDAAYGDLDARIEARGPGQAAELGEAIDTLLSSRASEIYELRGEKEEFERRFNDERQLTGDGLDIVSRLDMKAVVPASVNALKKLTGSDTALVYIYNGQTGTIIADPAAGGMEKVFIGQAPYIELKIGQCLAGWAAEHNQHAITGNVEYEERYDPEFSRNFNFPVRSSMVVPVRHDNVVIGVTQLINKPDGFGDEDVEKVTALNRYIAVAVINARQATAQGD